MEAKATMKIVADFPIKRSASLPNHQQPEDLGAAIPYHLRNDVGNDDAIATGSDNNNIDTMMLRDKNISNEEEPATRFLQTLQETALARIKESNEILQCFEDPNQQLLLVEGPCGAGKTRLILQTLSSRVASAGGYVLVGKYDPLQRPEPYVAFCSAFTQFVTQVIQNGRTAAVRKALAENLGMDYNKDWKVLVAMIPKLQQLFLDEEATDSCRETNPSASIRRQPNCAWKRFAYVFLMFLRSISSLGVPVVLLLDDLHFADQCSLHVLLNIVRDLVNCPSLFVVVTYDGESNCSTFQEALEEIAESSCNSVVTRVSVGNLTQEDLGRFLSVALNMKCSQKIAELALLVFEQTNGNVFYIVEFVKYLLTNSLLYASSTGRGYDLQKIKRSVTTCHISDFLMLRLEALAPELQDILKVASCCGTHVPVYLLHCIYGEMTFPLLEEASALELLKMDHGLETYAFPHDIIQQVVYEMIPKAERAPFHLEIGRRLWNAIGADDLEKSMYVLLYQFFFAKHLVTDRKERYDLAQLCLLVGRNAAASSTFNTACFYLNLGIEFLGETGWRDQYHLSLALYNAAAEMHLCVTDFDEMERLVNVVLKESRPTDRIHAETTRVYALGMTNKQNEAIDLGIQLLARLGESFPRRLCMAHVLIEAARVRKQLIGKSDEELLCLPTMLDPEKLACIQILNLLFLHIFLVRPKLIPFVALKFTSLTLKYGQCLLSPQAFAVYGMILARIGQIDEGYRFGQLGVKMLERLGQDESLPRVYASFYGGIYPLKRPLSEAIVKLHEGYRVGLQTGDFEFGCLNANLQVYFSMYAGVPLHSVCNEIIRMTSVMTALGQETMLLFSRPWVQSVHHYMGLTEDPLSSKGDIFDYEEEYQRCLQNNLGNMATGIILHRLFLSCIFNDFLGAEEQGSKCLGDIENLPTVDHIAFTFLFVSIAYLENARTFWKKRKAFRIARRGACWLKRLSLSCPFNYSQMRLLLEAEVANAKGQDGVAFELYSCSIACAKTSASLMIEAFGNERCGRSLYKAKRLEEARSFFVEACKVYETWGGMAKVIRLKEEIHSLFGSEIS